MARPTLLAHRKLRRLAHLLDLPRPYAVGLLEVLWLGVYESGDDRLGDRVDVELAAEWPGERGRFAEAVIVAGFVDEVDGVCTVHDLDDHCPRYVADRRVREAERRTKGTSVRELRAEAGRMGAAARWQTDGKRMANGAACHPDDGKRMANVGTPAPAQIGLIETGEREARAGEVPDPIAPAEDAFSELWAAYPRKEGEIAARHAFVIAQTAPGPLRLPPHAELMALLRVQAAAREPVHFTTLEKWIRGAKWRDKFPAKPAPRASSAPSPFPNIAQAQPQGSDLDPVDLVVAALVGRALGADPDLDVDRAAVAIRSELLARREEPEVAQALADRDHAALRHLLAPLGGAA